MNWSPEELKNLRGRMGWSQAEMARCLKLDLSTVAAWESGQAKPESKCHNQLSMILNQAESNSEQVHRRPIADIIMKSKGLTQIHDVDLINFVPLQLAKPVIEN